MDQFDKKMKTQKNTYTYFKSLGFIWNVFADMLLVSSETLRRRIVEYGITDLIGFRNISNDETEILIWDYRKIHGFACGRLKVLVHFNSIGKKAFHGNSCSHRLYSFHMR